MGELRQQPDAQLVRLLQEERSFDPLPVASLDFHAPLREGHDRSNPEDVRGLEAVKHAAADYRQAFPDLHVTVEDLIAEGDRVTARLRFRGTHLGELDGIAPTGRRVDCTGTVISRIEKGKIAEVWTNFDDLGMMQQLRLISEPGQRPPVRTHMPGKG